MTRSFPRGALGLAVVTALAAGACTKKTEQTAEPRAAPPAAAEAVAPAPPPAPPPPPPYDWKPVFAPGFLTAAAAEGEKKATPSAADAARFVAHSPSLTAAAPTSGLTDAQKGHCLVAALLQQNVEATADSYGLGGSIAVGACSVRLDGRTVEITAGNLRFFRALACPEGRFGDLAKEKPTWVKLRQEPELARCAASREAFVTEQIEATLTLAKGKGKGAKAPTAKYVSGHVGKDGGPCAATIEKGVARFKDCVDFERLETTDASGKTVVEMIVVAQDGFERGTAAGSTAVYGDATFGLTVGDWSGKAVHAVTVGEPSVELERGKEKVQVTRGAAGEEGDLLWVLRALRRNLQAAK